MIYLIVFQGKIQDVVMLGMDLNLQLSCQQSEKLFSPELLQLTFANHDWRTKT